MWCSSERSKSRKPIGPCPSRSVVQDGSAAAKSGIVNGRIVHGRACRAEKGALVSTGSGDEERVGR
jgi:hypothetical protein